MQHPDRMISGMKLLAFCQTADGWTPLKDQNLAALFREKSSGGQTVMSGTDYYNIVCIVCGCFHTFLDMP
jgi:hypothetical protein